MIKDLITKIKDLYRHFIIEQRPLPLVNQTVSPQSFKMGLYGVIAGLVTLSILWSTGQRTMKAICVRVMDSDGITARNDRKVAVEATPLSFGALSKRVTAVGRTRASEYVVIRSEVNARLKEILFTEGSLVTKDEEIIRFENTELKAELEQAEARLATARANFKRTTQLHEKNFGSQREYDKDKGEFDQASANVSVLKARLDKTVIRAPFTGQIGLMDANVGAFVTTNTELVTLVQSNPMKIDFKVPEKFAHEVGVGQIAEVVVDAYPHKIFQAFVEAVDSKVDPDSNSLTIRATIDNSMADLIPGLFAKVSLAIGERNNVPMVDESAILREGTIEYVWVVDKGKGARRPVRTGVREKNMVEIVDGLRKGDIVVTAGQVRLQYDGVRVDVINDQQELDKMRQEKKESQDKFKLEAKQLAEQENIKAQSLEQSKKQSSTDKSYPKATADKVSKASEIKEPDASTKDSANATSSVSQPASSSATTSSTVNK